MKNNLKITEKDPEANSLIAALGITTKRSAAITASVVKALEEHSTISAQFSHCSENARTSAELGFACFQIGTLRNLRKKSTKQSKKPSDSVAAKDILKRLLDGVDPDKIEVSSHEGVTVVKAGLKGDFNPNDLAVIDDSSDDFGTSFGITRDRQKELAKRCSDLSKENTTSEGVNVVALLEIMSKEVKHINELIYVTFMLGAGAKRAKTDGKDLLKKLLGDLDPDED